MIRSAATLTTAGIFSVITLVLLFFSFDIQAEQAPLERRSPMMGDAVWDALRAEEREIQRRTERIKAEYSSIARSELADTDWAKEWAGAYYTGDGLGTNVSIHLAPENGISFLNYGCLGLYGGDHGDVVEVLSDGLRLDLKFGDANNSYLSERVYFVRWDTERFLVPEWLMMELVNDYNKGGWQRYSMFNIPRFVPDGVNVHEFRSGSLRPTGKPQVPVQFEDMLLDQPVALRVSRVGQFTTNTDDDGWVYQTCVVTFDRGTDAGIRAGMAFDYQSDTPNVFSDFRITFADDGVATAQFKVYSRTGVIANLPARGDVVPAGSSDAPITGSSDD